jgi:drug/metabolite transporter (DMT)-like permease
MRADSRAAVKPTPVETDPAHRRAVLMLLATAILWSLGGLLIKWVDWNPVAIAGTRSLIGAVVIALIFRKELKFTGSFEQIGAAVAYAGTVVLFVVANKLTTAANAILLQYTAPVYVALFSPWFLGERARGNDWLSLAVILVGMLLFFGDELSLDGYVGNGVALASGFCFAWLTLFLRRHREESAISALVLGNLLAGLIGLPFMFQSMPDATSWVGLLLLGVVQLGLPYVMYALALRHVHAMEGILIPMIEPVLNPVWVFLMMGETPGPWAIVGGTIILGAVIFRARQGSRD